MEEPLSLTEQLRQFSSGNQLFAEVILLQVLPELHRIAVRELNRERDVILLSPAELINEVWLRNLRKGGWQINNLQHFYAIAAVAIRQVLVDLSRTRRAQRRGGAQTFVSLSENTSRLIAERSDPETLVQLSILMERLRKANPQIAHIVNLHYFDGFTRNEIAEMTGLTARQVRYLWESGRDWLKDWLREYA